MKNHYDIADNEINPGDFVVYAALWDRSATLKYGIVTRLSERKKSEYTRNEGDKYTVRVLSVDRTTRWVLVPNGPSLGTTSHVERRKTVTWELQKNGKEMALGFLDRLLVVPVAMVPVEALTVLRRAYKERIDKK